MPIRRSSLLFSALLAGAAQALVPHPRFTEAELLQRARDRMFRQQNVEDAPADAAHAWAPEDVMDPGLPGAAFTMYLGNASAVSCHADEKCFREELPMRLLEETLKETLRWPGTVRVLKTERAAPDLAGRFARRYPCVSYKVGGLHGDQDEKNGEYWRQSWGASSTAADYRYNHAVYKHAHNDGTHDWLYWGGGELPNLGPQVPEWLVSNKLGSSIVSLAGRGCPAVREYKDGGCMEPKDVPVWYKQKELYDDHYNMRPTFVRANSIAVECQPLDILQLDVRLTLPQCDGRGMAALDGVRTALRHVIGTGGNHPFTSRIVRALRLFDGQHRDAGRGVAPGARVMFSGIYDNRIRTRSCMPHVKLFDGATHQTLHDAVRGTAEESSYEEKRYPHFRNSWLTPAERNMRTALRAQDTRNRAKDAKNAVLIKAGIMSANYASEHAQRLAQGPCVGCCDKPAYISFCPNYKMLGWCADKAYQVRCPKTCDSCDSMEAAFEAIAVTTAAPTEAMGRGLERTFRFGVDLPQQRRFSAESRRIIADAFVEGGLGLTAKYLRIAKVVDASWIDFERFHGASGGLHVMVDVTVDGDICSPYRSLGYGLRGNPVDHSLCACFRQKVGAPHIHGEVDTAPCDTLNKMVVGERFKEDFAKLLEHHECSWLFNHATQGCSALLGGRSSYDWRLTGVEKVGHLLKSPAPTAAVVSVGVNGQRVKIEPLSINPSSKHALVGRLMWDENGGWKDICFKGGVGQFGKRAAKVACAQLGFERATLYNGQLPAPCWSLGGCDDGPNYEFVEFDCLGTEGALQDCVLRGHRQRIMCTHMNDVIIGCDVPTAGHVRVESDALDGRAPAAPLLSPVGIASAAPDGGVQLRPAAP